METMFSGVIYASEIIRARAFPAQTIILQRGLPQTDGGVVLGMTRPEHS